MIAEFQILFNVNKRYFNSIKIKLRDFREKLRFVLVYDILKNVE